MSEARRPLRPGWSKVSAAGRRLLEVAVHLASAEGLEGLTIGRLATETRMSKRTVVEAQATQLDKKVDPAQLVFEINALEMGANWAFQLHLT